MKLSSMIIFMVILQAVIMFYTGLAPTDDFEMVPYEDNDTVIWNFATDPTGWKTTPLLVIILALGAISAAFIATGLFLRTPSDTAIFSPIFLTLIAAGSVPILSLYTVFSNNYAMFGCEIDAVCLPSLWAWAITGGLIGLLYVISVLEWWSGRTMG